MKWAARHDGNCHSTILCQKSPELNFHPNEFLDNISDMLSWIGLELLLCLQIYFLLSYFTSNPRVVLQ